MQADQENDGPGGWTPEPDALYEPEEAASFLRLKRKKSIYDIPAQQLPKTKVGPRGGLVRYFGRDLLEYARRRRVAA